MPRNAPHLAAHGRHQRAVAGAGAGAQAGDEFAQRGHLAVDQGGQRVDLGTRRVVGRDAQGHALDGIFQPQVGLDGAVVQVAADACAFMAFDFVLQLVHQGGLFDDAQQFGCGTRQRGGVLVVVAAVGQPQQQVAVTLPVAGQRHHDKGAHVQ